MGSVRLTAVILLMAVLIANCYSVERTEAQRYYDLGVSYIKSDLYEDGLKTLNQVAFLYPDSDVADDALYQLALIREGVGDGRIAIGEARRLATVTEEVNRLMLTRKKYYVKYERLADILITVNAFLDGKITLELAKEQAIAQYLLALDYLNTLFQRYPDSDKLDESNLALKHIAAKIEQLMPPPKRPVNTKERLVKFALVGAFLVGFIILLSRHE